MTTVDLESPFGSIERSKLGVVWAVAGAVPVAAGAVEVGVAAGTTAVSTAVGVAAGVAEGEEAVFGSEGS